MTHVIGRVKALGKEIGEDLLGDLAGDFAGVDELNQRGQFFGGQLGFTGGQAGLVEFAQKFALHPVGGFFGVGPGGHGGFEVFGHVALGGEHFGVVVGQAEGGDKAGAAGFGQLGQLGAPFFQGGGLDAHGHEVGVREIAVVVGLFLAAHGGGDVFGGVVEAGFLDDGPAVVEDVGLAFHFVFNGFLDVAEAV